MRAGASLFAVAVLALPLVVHAEGEDPTAAAAPKPAHHKVVKKKKPAAVVATAPAGPIPYTSLNPAAAPPPLAKAPVMAAPLPAPVVVAVVPAVPPPPPPPPAAMLAPSPPPQPAPVPRIDATEINLKCDTVTNDGKKTLTSGSFYINLFPSQIFPDEQADFKFDQVDPRHASLVRESSCMDTLCDAKVSGSAYYLVNRVTRHGAALRITLNRATGAFYAEQISPMGLTNPRASHIGESGFCVPQKLQGTMF